MRSPIQPFLVIACVVAWGCKGAESAERPKSGVNFDKNNDGLISPDEARLAFEHRSLGKSANGDGNISDCELLDNSKRTKEGFDDSVRDFGARALPLSEFDSTFFPDANKYDLTREYPLLQDLRLRRSLDGGIQDLLNPDSFKTSKPAVFSYGHDRLADATSWTARGVVAYPIPLAQDAGALENLAILPSVSFDRVTNTKDASKEVSDVVYRAGLESYWVHDTKFGSSISLRGGYASDFDGESGMVTAEAEWQPVIPLVGLGHNQFVPGTDRVVEYRLGLVVHAEYSAVTATGGRASLVRNADVTRVGPKIRLDLFPAIRPLDRLTVGISWGDFAEVAGDLGGTRMFEVDASWKLDTDGHVELTSYYRNGDTPILAKEIDEFQVALGIKF